VQSVAFDMQQQLGAFKDGIGARLNHPTAVCTQLNENAKSRRVVYSSPRMERKSSDDDRSMNVMVFGVAENNDVRVWRRVVDRASQFMAGCEVDVKDMLRVRRYADGKTRPIVVKLRTSWDRRIILAECAKLKDFEERVFFTADEPLGERRKKMSSRLKVRAESNDQVVSVINRFSEWQGSIFIEGWQSLPRCWTSISLPYYRFLHSTVVAIIQLNIASVMYKCNIMFLQEHWLSDMQLNALHGISENVWFHAISAWL
jgi:hypothetical protein